MIKFIYFFLFLFLFSQASFYYVKNYSVEQANSFKLKKESCCKNESQSCCDKSNSTKNSCNNKENSKCYCSNTISFIFMMNENVKSLFFNEIIYSKKIWNYTSIQKQNVIFSLLHPPAI